MSATYFTSSNPVEVNSPFSLIWTDFVFSFPPGINYILQLDLQGSITSVTTTGTGSGTLTFDNITLTTIGNYTVSVVGTGYNTTASLPLTVTCFVEGTEILCVSDNKEDYVKVEDLTENMMVQTYLHGPKKIFGISKRQYKNDKTYSQICKLSGYSGQTKDLFLTGGHSILVDELTESQIEHTRPYNTLERPIDDKKLLLCCINENAEKIDDDKVYNVYHVILENDNIMGQYGIYANGILAESMSIDTYNNLRGTLCVVKNIF